MIDLLVFRPAYIAQCTLDKIQNSNRFAHLDEYIHLDLSGLSKLGDSPRVSLVECEQHRHLESRRLQRVPAKP